MSKKKNRITFAGIINAIILGLFTLICVYPLWYIFINSWSSPAAVNRGVYIIPQELFHRGLYESAGNSGPDLQYRHRLCPYDTWNAAYAAVRSFAAYLLANRDLPCRKLLYRFFIVTMYVNAGFIPYYLLISNIGLKNNFLVYILPYAVQAYFIILIKTYIESIPSELVGIGGNGRRRAGKGLFPDYTASGQADSGLYRRVCSGKSVEYLVG